VPGIEFRSVAVEAFKGKHGPCFERKQAIIYKGPFEEVLDDDGHRLRRGERTAVCDKTFQIYRKEPYASHVEFVEPTQVDHPRRCRALRLCARCAPASP